MGEKALAAFLSGVSLALPVGWAAGATLPARSAFGVMALALVSLSISYLFDKRTSEGETDG